MLREEDTKEYWDKQWTFGEGRLERVVLDGSDGEVEFDRELLRRTVGKRVLDEGCGSGKFTLKIARRARRVVGIDISPVALAQAREKLARAGLANVDFCLGDADHVPFPENSFEVVYSRRGPGSDSLRTMAEAYRALRTNGVFLEITIGERDKQNLARIFRRGQMLGVKGQVSRRKKAMLEKTGFSKVVAPDYLATEVFRAMNDLLVRLRSAPIIPSFDPRKDREHLVRVQKEGMTDRGIETPVHRVVLIGQK